MPIRALSIRYHLGLLVLVTAIPLLGLSVLLFDRMFDSEHQTVRSALMNSARTLAALVDNEIDTHMAIAATLSHSHALETRDYAAFWQEAKTALAFIPGAWVELCDPSGQFILTTLVEYGAPLPHRQDLELQTRAFATGQIQVSDLMMDPISGLQNTYVESPVLKDGVPLYSLLISMNSERFLKVIQGKFDQGELIGVLDREAKFVARIPDHDARLGSLASTGWRGAIAKAPNGWVENVTLEGDLALTAYASTTRGWIAGISYKMAVIEAPLYAIMRTLGLLAGGLAVLSIALAFLQARRFAANMGALAALARDVGAGRVVEPPRSVFREGEMIGKALSDASVLLEQRGRDLSQLNAELEVKVACRTSALVAEMARREESEGKFRQAQKMEAIGQLTGGIAHDFNNMLGVIRGSLDLMQRRLERGDFAIERFLEAATKAAERAAALTHRLLAFARQQPLAPEPIDANKMIVGMSDLLRSTLGEHIRIETVSAAGLWAVNADSHQLESAILNIAINARDAMPDGGKLTIETGNAYLDDDYCRRHTDVEPGQFVLIAVSDTGAGIPAQIVARVFDPFFTTKPTGKGTGLGLSQVYGFVKQSHGHIKIYSEVDAGTTVKIYLPRLVGAADEIKRTSPQPAQMGNGEIVLVVEDDPLMRRLSSEALSELGYKVLHSDTAADALTVLDRTAEITLLFTDVVMPDINGRKLADEALRRRPGLKVLFTTGYTPNAVVHGGVLDPGVNLLSKPFTVEQLAAKVRAVLGE